MAEPILLSIEDDDSEHFLIVIALKELAISIRHFRVTDGEEGIQFLQNTQGHELAPRPDLVLLNLQSPQEERFRGSR